MVAATPAAPPLGVPPPAAPPPLAACVSVFDDELLLHALSGNSSPFAVKAVTSNIEVDCRRRMIHLGLLVLDPDATTRT
jgi:hypothetical protein